MRKTIVINVVGLTKRLIGEHTPFIHSFLSKGSAAAIKPVIPAVTCTAQSTYLTGKLPVEHGIVGNGWYFRDECEIHFWRQSNKLVEGEKIWDRMKSIDNTFTCANMFWWYNMYSNADYSVTPRPNYLADGRKIPDAYSHPPGLRDDLQRELGPFPLFHFWGPRTTIKSSQWIADATIKTDERYQPTLTLVYLPHLDYNLQKYGLDFPKISKDLKEVDRVVEQLVKYYEQQQSQIMILSEYGITNVHQPVHINRILRAQGLLAIREERGLELLDAGASAAFAVADHQLAHIYINDLTKKAAVKRLLQETAGIEKVWSQGDEEYEKMAHSRCGDLIAVADCDSWFTYYFWNSDSKAPDYARMVDIHKKPGYDPVELFTDPEDKFLMIKILGKLARKKIGFRTVMDIIPLKPSLVKGSHGRLPEDEDDYPILITNGIDLLNSEQIDATDICSIIEDHLLKK